LRAANITIVSPFGPSAFASAPPFSRRSTMAGIAVQRGHRERGHPLTVGDGFRTSAQQQIDCVDTAAIDRPVQRGCPVTLRRVDVRTLLDQRPHGREIPPHDGVRHIGPCGADAGTDAQNDDEHAKLY
jgi:hypothetical protein